MKPLYLTYDISVDSVPSAGVIRYVVLIRSANKENLGIVGLNLPENPFYNTYVTYFNIVSSSPNPGLDNDGSGNCSFLSIDDALTYILSQTSTVIDPIISSANNYVGTTFYNYAGFINIDQDVNDADNLRQPINSNLTQISSIGSSLSSDVISVLSASNVSAIKTLIGSGSANGLATLDSGGKVPTSEIPTLPYVSSVGVSMPSGFTVSASPVTSSGTLAVSTTLNGMVKGTGSGFTTATAGTDFLAPTGNGSGLTGIATSVNGQTGAVTVASSKAYEGTALRSGAFPIFKSATVSSGTASFYLTDDGTSTGNALFPNGVVMDSVNLTVNDATAAYQMSWAWSNSNKTLTVTANKLGTANILTGILGQIQANSAVIKLTVWGY
jgi:hypothetical protein